VTAATVEPDPTIASSDLGDFMTGQDESSGLWFAESGHLRVYVSDRKRLALYDKGIDGRIDYLLNDYRIPKDALSPGDVVVDVGANNGELGLWARQHSARYIAFEPDPTAYAALSLNHPTADVHNVALGDAAGHASFFLATSDADSSLFRPEHFDEEVQVEVRTLDSSLAFDSIATIRLLKVEAEGMEPEVLAGAAKTLAITELAAVDAGPERGGENTVPQVLNVLSDAGFAVESANLLRGTFLLRNTNLDRAENSPSSQAPAVTQ
jgi:FkbM family methyltransferase